MSLSIEDNSRKREGDAAQNFPVLSRIALNLLKNEKSTKCGVKGKRLKAGWDNVYLAKLLKIQMRLPCIATAKFLSVCVKFKKISCIFAKI